MRSARIRWSGSSNLNGILWHGSIKPSRIWAEFIRERKKRNLKCLWRCAIRGTANPFRSSTLIQSYFSFLGRSTNKMNWINSHENGYIDRRYRSTNSPGNSFQVLILKRSFIWLCIAFYIFLHAVFLPLPFSTLSIANLGQIAIILCDTFVHIYTQKYNHKAKNSTNISNASGTHGTLNIY